MDLRKLLMTGVLAMSPLGQQAEQGIESSLDTHKENIKDEISYVLVSSDIPKDSISNYKLGEVVHTVLDKDGEVIVRRPTKDLAKTPLHMQKVRRDFGSVLGYNQSDSILQKYNSGKRFLSSQKYALLDTLNFPLIYPELKKYFPTSLSELVSLESFSSMLDSVDLSGSLAAVQQVDSGKHALGLYKDSALVLCTYVSVGKGHSTPEGLFFTQRRIAYCWSQKHDAPMPYGVEFKATKYFFHQGVVNGTPLSLGCVRIPGLYAEVFYNLIEQETPVALSDNIYNKQK